MKITMRPERISGDLAARPLGKFVKSYFEEGGNGILGGMLLRIEKQFGSHISLSSEALSEIERLRQSEFLSGEDKARLFEVITSGKGAPCTHMSGKVKEGLEHRKRYGCRFLNFSRRRT